MGFQQFALLAGNWWTRQIAVNSPEFSDWIIQSVLLFTCGDPGRCESAGQNRHGVGGASPPRSKG